MLRMWFKGKKLKKQHLVFLIIALLAVLIGITMVNSISERQDLADAAAKARLAAELQLKKVQNALDGLSLAARYQQFCTTSVMQIEMADKYTKTISKTGSIQYFRDAQRVYCTPTSTTNECKLVLSLTFTPIYTCPQEVIATASSGATGAQIKNQQVGNAVIVDTIVIEKPGFVVVRALGYAKKPGDVLAAGPYLEAGAYSIVSIAMPKTLVSGQRYALTIAQDDGDKTFDAAKDTFVTTSDGTMLFAPFTAVKK